MARFSWLLCALLVGLAGSALGETSSVNPPTWHSFDGKSLDVGTFANYSNGSVTLKKPDGSTSQVDFGRLSFADRAVAITGKDKGSEFQKPIRRWTSASGAYHVDAKAILAGSQYVKLLKSDNKLVVVSVENLSKSDREYLKRLMKAAAIQAADGNPFEAPDNDFETAEPSYRKSSTDSDSSQKTMPSHATAKKPK